MYRKHVTNEKRGRKLCGDELLPSLSDSKLILGLKKIFIACLVNLYTNAIVVHSKNTYSTMLDCRKYASLMLAYL